MQAQCSWQTQLPIGKLVESNSLFFNFELKIRITQGY